MSSPHLPAVISAAIRSSIQDAVAAGELDVAIPVAVPLRRAELGRGHFASTVALALGAAHAPAVARIVARRLRATPGIADVEVAGPGFLNVTVDDAELAGMARAIVLDPSTRGDHQALPGECELDPELAERVRLAHGRLCALATQAAAHGVLAHLAGVAECFHSCFAATRLTPRGPDPVTDLHRTRLWLAEATRIVLADGLHRLGLTAPEHI